MASTPWHHPSGPSANELRATLAAAGVLAPHGEYVGPNQTRPHPGYQVVPCCVCGAPTICAVTMALPITCGYADCTAAAGEVVS